ncbi:MAG: TolC family protein [Bacteroides sp.]
MNRKKYVYNIIVFFVLSISLYAQEKTVNLSIEQSAACMGKGNRTLKIANKEVEMAKNERRKLNSLWYPNVSMAGAYVHLSNKIEVKEPLNKFTNPAKEIVHSILPNDQLIGAMLDEVGKYSFTFPLLPSNLTTIDGNVTWALFTGGKRIYATKIARSMVTIAEVNKELTNAGLQALLVESYYGLRLGQRIVEVRMEAYNVLKKHYWNAQKQEQNGLINKAERLFAEVNMDEAKRELATARKEVGVLQKTLNNLLNFTADEVVNPVSSLFMNDTLPPIEHFKAMIEGSNYTVNTLRLQENIARNQLKIGRAGYMPNIALLGKQTFYANGMPKNLFPRTMIGVGFTWNIFDGLDRESNVRQAKLAQQSLVLGREKAKSELAVAVDKLYSQLQNAQDNVTMLNTTIAMSKELLRVRRKLFREGMAVSTEVVDAQLLLSKVQIAYLTSYYQYDVALINLLSTCGIPDAFYGYSKEGRTEHFIFNEE